MEFAAGSMLVSSLVSKITSSAAILKAGGAASSTVLAALSSQGVNLLSQASLGPAAASALGTLNVGSLLAGCPPAVLAACQVGAKAAAVAIGGAAAMAAVPAVLTALGFTGAGIAAGSIGAKMMSIAAIANGGGVPAGGLVATLQSAGAAGLSLSSKVILGSTGSALVAHAVGL